MADEDEESESESSSGSAGGPPDDLGSIRSLEKTPTSLISVSAELEDEEASNITPTPE